jgi:hypothetical protein
MRQLLVVTAVAFFGFIGCAQEKLPQPVVSDVRSDGSIEAVTQGSVLIDYDGEEIPTMKSLKEVSWTDEVRKDVGFRAQINRQDFAAARSHICEFEDYVHEKGGEILIHELAGKGDSPSIRVSFPSKVKKID